MKIYHAGQVVDYGVYVAAWPPDMHFVGADGEALGGHDGVAYRRIPTLLVVAAGPAIGGAFVLLFPLLIIAAVVAAAAKLVATQVRAIGERNAHLASVRWEPATAYLDGGEDADRAESEDDAEPDELDELRPKVAARLSAEREEGTRKEDQS